MDCSGERQPLLLGLADSATRADCGSAPARRRHRRVKSAPMTECVHLHANGNDSHPPSVSNFGEIHPSLRKVAAFLAIYLGVGTISFYLVRNDINGKKTNGVLDSVYFCIVTMTTVGYGDLVPDSNLAKLLACIYVVTGTALVGLILSKAADYLVEKQEILLVKAMHVRHTVGPFDIMKEIESNKVKYKCYLAFIILVVLMVSGTVFLFLVEDLDFMDAFYCVCSTITTLGYGDKSFSTRIGRSFAIIWIMTSTLGLALFFLYLAELFTEQRQRALVKWVLTRKTTNVDLEAADIDNDGVVGAAEFILYKLKEMGKITQEDISLVREEFEDLDIDQSGTLSASDLMLAQEKEQRGN